MESALNDMPGRTLASALTAAASVLSHAGVPSPRVDAELLAAHVLNITRGRLAIGPPMSGEQLAAFDRLVAARAGRVPLQHLTGSAPFHLLELAVGPGVFIPRFETELLVEWALSAVPHKKPTIVDLCSGSGAIALSVAVALPSSEVYAVERSPSALTWLAVNVSRLAPRVRVVTGDGTDPAMLSELDGLVDLVLCNPPYVPRDAPVDIEVARFDPPEAVFAGVDGLDLIPGIARRAAALLRPGGLLGLEHDDTQGASVPELLRETGRFDLVTDHRDLAGRPRYATARRLA